MIKFRVIKRGYCLQGKEEIYYVLVKGKSAKEYKKNAILAAQELTAVKEAGIKAFFIYPSIQDNDPQEWQRIFK